MGNTNKMMIYIPKLRAGQYLLLFHTHYHENFYYSETNSCKKTFGKNKLLNFENSILRKRNQTKMLHKQKGYTSTQ